VCSVYLVRRNAVDAETYDMDNIISDRNGGPTLLERGNRGNLATEDRLSSEDQWVRAQRSRIRLPLRGSVLAWI
jgi:hypothetical protein